MKHLPWLFYPPTWLLAAKISALSIFKKLYPIQKSLDLSNSLLLQFKVVQPAELVRYSKPLKALYLKVLSVYEALLVILPTNLVLFNWG